MAPAKETDEGDASPERKEGEEEDLALKDITDPKDTDVLCGRGGAALRHPGNQTYRRLVNLNKGLYITCLKTEKLKISRSIVAAIREQHGRFLERDAKKSTWFDIGDKKAIEKTSQALREGQPKLRKAMVAKGQIPPSNKVEQELSNGVYNPKSGHDNRMGSGNYSNQSSYGMQQAPPTQMHQHTPSMAEMPPPPSRTLSKEIDNETSTDVMMQRLSLSSIPQSIPSWTPSVASSFADNSLKTRLRPSLQPRGSGVANELGIPLQTNLSIMSDFSAYSEGIAESSYGMEVDAGMDQLNHPYLTAAGNAHLPPPPPPAMSPMMMESPSMYRSGKSDRRRMFAKMKSARSGASQTGDGMPDIHMVDSNYSLLSNLSNHGSKHQDANGMSNFSDHGRRDSLGQCDYNLGSRRSLMSGLSRISDTSVGLSVFSDLSKKVSNVSALSIATSEMSGMDGVLHENIDDAFNLDHTRQQLNDL